MTDEGEYVQLDTDFSAVKALAQRQEHRRQRRIRGTKRFFIYTSGLTIIGLFAGLARTGVAVAHDVALADAALVGLWCIVGALIAAFLGMGACSFSLATGVTPWAIYVHSTPGDLEQFDQDAKSVLNAGLIAAVIGATVAGGLGTEADGAGAIAITSTALAAIVGAVIVAASIHAKGRLPS